MAETEVKAGAELALRQVNAWYGESHVLHGVEMSVGDGELVTLIGRNGAGKSTTLKAIMGMIGRVEGSITYAGRELVGRTPENIARAGIAYCPEERGIYSSLNVEENLLLPRIVAPGGLPLADLYRLFPNLAERRTSQGSKLSGGEQQMLAIARILRTGAPLLLLDEPTEGLAPVVVQEIEKLIRSLMSKGLTILLVEQNLHFATMVADRHYVMENGKIIDVIERGQVGASKATLERYLGV
ncbi:MAG: ABC transporter ATP-binding protein [Alphaproteobacteria bacterium]|nr:MAG: ABC transporter ATP-binding protein [Alphaproteobacteria bacterium]